MSIIKTKAATNAAAAAEGPMLTPEEVLEQLHALRARIPEFVQLPKTRATEIRRAARVSLEFAREAFSSVGASPMVQEIVGNTPEELHQADAEMVRWNAVESELNALLRGVAAANLLRRERIARVALHAYNVSRELAKQEDHASLLPYVERMKRLPRYGRRRRAPEVLPPVPPPDPA